MRALAEHDDFYVPALLAVDVLKTTTLPKAMLFSDKFEADPTVLPIFTDGVAARRAEGHRIGLYAGGVPGVALFPAFGPPYVRVNVNPVSPAAESWYFDEGAFVAARIWAQVVELERALAAATDVTIPHAQLKAHPGYLILVRPPHNEPVYASVKGIDGPVALAFTAPDRAQGYLSRVPAGDPMRTATLDGASLFRQLGELGAAAVAFNPGSPTSTIVLPALQFAKIIAA